MTEIPQVKTLTADSELWDELVLEACKCLECGKCTGSCPMNQLFPDDFHPHHLLTELMRDPEEAIKDPGLWFCASCYKCNKRCPQAIEFPNIIMNLRNLALKQDGEEPLRRAFEKIRTRIPFPLSYLYVCIHPERIDMDPSILGKLHEENLDRASQADFPETGRRVAVVGSGPAGLMAGYELIKKGYKVRVFESGSVAGGMFSLAIPEYRVPLQIVRDEIRLMEELGMELRVNTRIGEDLPFEQLLGEEYDAVLLATGSHGCKALDIPGDDFEGVYNSLEFLREMKIHKKEIRNKTVAVIGGGNTAMDSASVAMHYGAKETFLLYRRTKEEMPADINEIREAEKEGVQLRFLEAPLSIQGDKSRVQRLECIKMELEDPDMSGRRKPVPLEDSRFALDVDLVVIAIGEKPDLGFSPELACGRGNTIPVNPYTMETSMPGVYAAGDNVSGPSTVADAILAGCRAAEGIDIKIKSA